MRVLALGVEHRRDRLKKRATVTRNGLTGTVTASSLDESEHLTYLRIEDLATHNVVRIDTLARTGGYISRLHSSSNSVLTRKAQAPKWRTEPLHTC
jgi:hypothetical protein